MLGYAARSAMVHRDDMVMSHAAVKEAAAGAEG